MPLPKVVAPTFELNLLSTGKPVKYRPFLVKEEKALLIALESGNTKDIMATVKEVMKSCLITRIKLDNLPTFDLEYLFLNIRGKSVGETVDLQVTCTDDGETQVPLTISLSDIGLDSSEDHNDTIDLGGNIKIKMRYPSMNEFLEQNFAVAKEKDTKKVDEAFKAVANCIDTIYTDEEAWTASDCTTSELIKFIENLSSAQFQKIETFFSTMPRLKYESKVKNPNTGIETDVVIEGLSNFFG